MRKDLMETILMDLALAVVGLAIFGLWWLLPPSS